MANTKITTSVIADGAITSAKLDTDISVSGSITGTLATAAQPNITSVGTLTGLDVAGTPTFDGLTVDGTGQITRLGLGVAPHATAPLNITTTNQHIRLNNGSELGVISVLSGGELDIWGHGDGESINFRTGSGAGTVAMNVVGTNVGIGTTNPNSALHIVGDTLGGILLKQSAQISYTPANEANFQQGITFENGGSGHAFSVGYGQGGVLKFSYFDNDSTYSELGQFNSAGDFKPAGSVIMNAGEGISFAANSHASGRTSEVLDDYEEGTFTLSISNGTLSYLYSSVSTYTKIGNRVFIDFGQLQITGTDTGSSALVLTGLPFTTSNQSNGVIGWINMPYGTAAPDIVSNFYIESNQIYFTARRGDYLLRNTDFNGESVAFSASAVYKTTQ